MSKCYINNCPFYVYLDSNRCSVHFKEHNGITKFISKQDLFNKYNLITQHETCNESYNLNIIDIIKKIPNNNPNKIIETIKQYLETINKKYINANLALIICNNFTMNHLIHYVYPLVRDYWNINENHSQLAICYYNTEYEYYSENIVFEENNIKFKLRKSYSQVIRLK
jgi:hypothetical protein|uniref:Uncharacterized protein n=1 Tax=viral metagenome TaxID=1070528 RepID=A0A6C0ITE5_9ZZZZ